MRILLAHNYYQQRGGEDAVYEAEKQLLLENGHAVETLTAHNDTIVTRLDKLKTTLGILSSSSAVGELCQKIQDFQPDIVHVHNLFPKLSPGVIRAARRAGVPVVMTLHNYRLVCAKATLFRNGKVCVECLNRSFPLPSIRNGCYRNSRIKTVALTAMSMGSRLNGTWRHCVNCFIVPSEVQKGILLQSCLDFHSERVFVKPNFISDPGILETGGRKGFLYVGRLSEEKGIISLLQSFQGTSYPLTIIGTGPLAEIVQQAATLSPNIEYIGFLERAQTIEKMRQTEALVFPSVWHETFGLGIIEAFSVGTPVIAYRIGAPGEIITHEENGLLVEAGNAEELGLAVAKLAGNPKIARQLGLQARKTYEAKYTPDKNYHILNTIYEQVLEDKGIC